MAEGVRIYLRSEQFFDLRAVMRAVGDLSELEWSLHDAYFNGDVTGMWPEGADSAGEESRHGGIRLDWQQMTVLAEQCRQISDGRFIGRGPAGQQVVVLSVVDSSFWEVRSSRSEVIAQTRRTFPDSEAISASHLV